MEEQVGELWHRLITRAARTGHHHAAVELKEVTRSVGVLFRALGGDGGLRVEACEPTPYEAPRGWLARIAGTGRKVNLAWRDERSLKLPPVIDLFPERERNRDLYHWLAAMAAAKLSGRLPWLARNQQLTVQTLLEYPGLRDRYRALVQAHLPQRPDPERLPPDEAAQERTIRAALADPGSVERLPPAARLPAPVPLWLHPCPPGGEAASARPAEGGDPPEADGNSHDIRDGRRRQAERTALPKKSGGLIALRMENILTWGEFAKVDREVMDEEDPLDAAKALEEMDLISVASEGRTSASRLRFDLDLPARACDDLYLGPGIRLPEWDYRRRQLRPQWCLLQPMVAAEAPPCPLPQPLKRTAEQLRRQFQLLAPSRRWHRAQPEGSEIDLEAYQQFLARRLAGSGDAEAGLYRDLRRGDRELACLLLADLSLSTDAYVNNDTRVIDVIRDSLFLFSEALAATGDRFALYGFSSRRRDHVRFHHLKGFGERHGSAVRGRIAALRPGYYTRMGAAIRHAGALLARQGAARRLLLILTDGKPNDLDLYEGRYGIEDTRMALLEARRQGLHPFCVTIDDRAGEYLPHLFGSGGYVVIRRPAELPRRLPQLYLKLTQ